MLEYTFSIGASMIHFGAEFYFLSAINSVIFVIFVISVIQFWADVLAADHSHY